MSASFLPGMGSLNTLGEWVEQNEELISQTLMVNAESGQMSARAPATAGRGFCALFLSRNAHGEFLLRSCEGADERFVIWRDQRRLRPMFGESYARAQLNLWLDAREQEGYRIEWSAQRELQSGLTPLPAVP